MNNLSTLGDDFDIFKVTEDELEEHNDVNTYGEVSLIM